jgi:hypothetical protein
MDEAYALVRHEQNSTKKINNKRQIQNEKLLLAIVLILCPLKKTYNQFNLTFTKAMLLL